MSSDDFGERIAEFIGRLFLWPLNILDRSRTAQAARIAALNEQAAKLQAEAERKAEEKRREQRDAEFEIQTAKRKAIAEEEAKLQEIREEARKQCLLAYHRYAASVADSMPWDRFGEYMNQFMSDSKPADVVMMRGKELCDMIKSFVEPQLPKSASQYGSLKEIEVAYQRKKDEILQLNCTDAERESQLAYVSMEETRAIRKFNAQ